MLRYFLYSELFLAEQNWIFFSSSTKSTMHDGFNREIELYNVNYIYSNVLTAQMWFKEPQFVQQFNVTVTYVYEYRPGRVGSKHSN